MKAAHKDIDIDNLLPELKEKLKCIEDEFGRELVINSGYRSAEHPIEAAKKTPGEHYNGGIGAAVDIACSTSRDRYHLITLAIQNGFNRIGVGNTFIHLGVSQTRAQDVIWTY